MKPYLMIMWRFHDSAIKEEHNIQTLKYLLMYVNRQFYDNPEFAI